MFWPGHSDDKLRTVAAYQAGEGYEAVFKLQGYCFTVIKIIHKGKIFKTATNLCKTSHTDPKVRPYNSKRNF